MEKLWNGRQGEGPTQRSQSSMFGDIGWRHDRLRGRARGGAGSILLSVTSIASLLLAAYYVAFAAYLLGDTYLADQQVWGRSPLQGFEAYAGEAGASIAASIVASLGFILALAAVARPIAHVFSDVATVPIASLAVMFFWLGVWPLGVMVIAGAAIDLAFRAPRINPPRA